MDQPILRLEKWKAFRSPGLIAGIAPTLGVYWNYIRRVIKYFTAFQ
jgi:hypothetical protein